MPIVVTRRRRAVRAATFGLVLTGSAVLAHAVAGGMLPGRGVILGAAAVLVVLGWLLAGRDRSSFGLTAAALGGQLALHLTFSLTMPGAMSMPSLLCGHPSASSTSSQTGLVGMRFTSTAAPSMTSHQMVLMMAAHAVGGVLVLLALRSAETVVGVVVGLLTAVLLWVLPAVSSPPVARVAAALPRRPLRSTTYFLCSPWRGPPVLACS